YRAVGSRRCTVAHCATCTAPEGLLASTSAPATAASPTSALAWLSHCCRAHRRCAVSSTVPKTLYQRRIHSSRSAAAEAPAVSLTSAPAWLSCGKRTAVVFYLSLREAVVHRRCAVPSVPNYALK
ncbi:unnamed protein product, partial [Ixodes persulcatus]